MESYWFDFSRGNMGKSDNPYNDKNVFLMNISACPFPSFPAFPVSSGREHAQISCNSKVHELVHVSVVLGPQDQRCCVFLRITQSRGWDVGPPCWWFSVSLVSVCSSLHEHMVDWFRLVVLTYSNPSPYHCWILKDHQNRSFWWILVDLTTYRYL